MAANKREVWAAAQQLGVDDFISRVSEAFGKDAIAAVMVSGRGVGALSTDDALLHIPDRVRPGYRMEASQVKAEINSSKNRSRLK